MPQSRTVMAFRKRLKSYGYTNIEITKRQGYIDLYTVRATEPLGKKYITVEYSSLQMNEAFKRIPTGK